MLEIKNLNLIYNKNLHILKNINFKVDKAEITGIIGLSGAGKTSILRSMVMLEKPTSGEINLNGKNLVLLKEKELRKESIAFKEELPIGIMIEVPSAALTADLLAKKVDFFSIGTNDLIQYTIAVDRGNEKIAYLYEPFHPGVLRLLKIVIESAHNASIPVGMCGEMAGYPLAAVLLLGLGLDIFSMSAFTIPEVKKIIRSVSMSEAEELAGIVMEMKSAPEIDTLVRKWMNERFDLIQ